jgi:hypothetical protein
MERCKTPEAVRKAVLRTLNCEPVPLTPPTVTDAFSALEGRSQRALSEHCAYVLTALQKRIGITHRLHDLRHTAVSRMIDEGIPLTVIGKIVGWAPSTVVHMSTIYGHSRMDKMRTAVNSITGKRQAEESQLPSFPRPSLSTESRNFLSY